MAFLYFPDDALTANPVFFRTYSRKRPNGLRENWKQTTERVADYLGVVGSLDQEEYGLVLQQQLQCKAMFSGRLNWSGGTPWIKKRENFYGAYNCTSTNIVDIESFGLMMNLAMQGCGTGAILEEKYISQLPTVKRRLNIEIAEPIGVIEKEKRIDNTYWHYEINADGTDNTVHLIVGDSRQGWVDSYEAILNFATTLGINFSSDIITIKVYLGNVRTKGENLKGFGGVANPIKLENLYRRVATILNKAFTRDGVLNSVECCTIIDESASCIVAGNIRRSAGMRQSGSNDELFAVAKDNLWQQTEDGNWRIDPERDALRMANHTRVFHHKPTLAECIDSVRKQYYSGEGAIQWAGETIARANADLLFTPSKKEDFINIYDAFGVRPAEGFLKAIALDLGITLPDEEVQHRMGRYGLNPCGK